MNARMLERGEKPCWRWRWSSPTAKKKSFRIVPNEVYFGQVAGASVQDRPGRTGLLWEVCCASGPGRGGSAGWNRVGAQPVLAAQASRPGHRATRPHAATNAVHWSDFTRAARQGEVRDPEVHPAVGHRRAPWFVDAAVEVVEDEWGEGAVAARGLAVHTTLHPVLQRLAERAVSEGGRELDQSHPAPRVRRLRWWRFGFGMARWWPWWVVATMAARSSTARSRAPTARLYRETAHVPAAFDRDVALSPVSLVEDAPLSRTVSGKTWSPKNYDGTYQEDVTYRDALAASRNIPAVLVAEQVGMPHLQRFWKAARA